MERWKTWTSLLFALVLSLGMMGVAVADPPDDHPACEKENSPKGCEDDGHPGNPEDEDEDENGEGEANPLAPLGEVCSQVVQALLDGGAPPELAEIHALCEALGAEPLDDDDDGGDGDPGDEESPTQPIADGCMEVVDGLVGGGVPAEDGEQLCAQFGDTDEGDGDPEPEPCDPEIEECGDEEPSPTQPIADGCMEVVDGLSDNGVPAQDGEQLCAQFGDTGEGDGDPEPEPEPEPCDPEAEECDGEESPLAPIADGCNTVIDELIGGGAPPELEEGRQLCNALP